MIPPTTTKPTTNNTDLFEEYWRFSSGELERHIEFLGELARLKTKFQQGASSCESSPALAARPPLAERGSSSLLRRAPMRPPKPGSLRASVHGILRKSTGPMRRSAVIAAVASARGAEADEKLIAKVGDILNNPHDESIRRVGHGIFALKGGDAR
jgi:hypothetical protein